jgi:hypothetical protein
MRAWRRKKSSLHELCLVCNQKHCEKGEELFSSIRHDLKNLLNGLTLVEYNANGNNQIIVELSKKIDLLVSKEHFEMHSVK